MKRNFVWVSFDLGVKGDYEGMYAWLDSHDAKECGDSVACFSYEHPSIDLLQDMKEDLNKNVELDTKKSRIYVVSNVDGKPKGKFIFGRRRNAPWVGVAATGEQGEDNG
ncbi:MAG: hypothetical protein ACRD3T_13520 [Terriglobia bacterium]